ncbi:hypothetical protein [Pseudonocardia sp. NPDC049635]|uniref:hypothetical protein n=1 Tax=Pseudonocardia sp. NPDC049635 TaxID=3155506 RepID=UPI00340F7305
MTAPESPSRGVRVDQLIQAAGNGKWHAPSSDGVTTACNQLTGDGDPIESVDDVPVPDRCHAPACRALWTGDAQEFAGNGIVPTRGGPRRDAGPDGPPMDGPAPLDDVDTEGGDRPLNPVESEAAIRKVARMIWTGVRVVTDAEEKFQEKEAAYERAFARAYMEYRGPAHAKKYAATLATEQERWERDVAERAFNHARNLQKAKLVSLDAVRSVNTSVREMYRADSGVGR